MYQCQNCEREFDTPEIIDEQVVCPYCKSGDIIGEDIEENESE